MKQLIILSIFILTLTLNAQIKGNKKIETRTFSFENITTIKVDLHAKISIDASINSGISITTDSNLFDFIDKEVVDGTINFNQKEWIQPSNDIIISIGAPNIERVFHNTHEVTKIINVNNDKLSVTAPIGTVFIEGQTDELRLGSELSKIDASKIIAQNIYIDLWSRGTVKVFPVQNISGKVSNKGKLIILNEPKLNQVKSDDKDYNTEVSVADNPRFINFKIKNNSLNRHHFFIVGSKPNGKTFSYGFPMMPSISRKEYWTTGTKVYKVNKMGLRKLLITIKPEDENKTIKLFK